MSVHEHTTRLVRVLEREAAQLAELAAAMQQERAAFVALWKGIPELKGTPA